MSTRLVAGPAAALGLLEAAHDGQGDWKAWCERLLAAARLLFTSESVNLGIARRTEHAYEVIAAAALQPELVDYWSSTASQASPDYLDRFWRFPGYVATVTSVAGEVTSGQPVDDFHQMVGARDTLGVIAIVDDVSLSIGAPHAVTIQIPAGVRQLLTSVALHIESGLRLRVCPGSTLAVLHPDGRVWHAVGKASHHAEAREHLTRHVTTVERGRTRRGRRSHESVTAWSALISGQWGLVERDEPGIGRHYVVLETARARHLRALTELETHVAELSARGLTGKTAAYALGISAGSVSKLLSSAALKLGLRGRTELVRLVASLLGTGPVRSFEGTLTPAEADVLALVRLGWTNASIARTRSRSERTVANQVASLLRKLEVSSRRALAVAAPTTRRPP